MRSRLIWLLTGILLTANLGIARVAAWANGDTAPIKTLTGANTGLDWPTEVAFDSFGLMYVTNFTGSSVTVYATNWANGNTAPIKTLTGANTGLNAPSAIAFDSSGRMYVTNFNANTVTVHAAGWANGDTAPIKTLTGANTGLDAPEGVAFDSSGRMYVINYNTFTVTAYAANWADGNTAPTKTLVGNTSALNGPYGLAFDSDDQMYIANFDNSTVVTYAAEVVSDDSEPMSNATGPSLFRVSLDANGGACIVDGASVTAATSVPFLGYRYIPSADECTKPGHTFAGWANKTDPTTVVKLPRLIDLRDNTWRYFIADNHDLIAVWTTS